MKYFQYIITHIVAYSIGVSSLWAVDNITDPVEIGLPGEKYTNTSLTSNESITSGIATVLVRIVPYILALAVLSLIIAGIYYLLSWGNEEKAKKAKNLVIMTIIGVVISTSAYTIISIVNSISLD